MHVHYICMYKCILYAYKYNVLIYIIYAPYILYIHIICIYIKIMLSLFLLL